jgi:putative CocE/NonD family hydrolase
LKATVFRDDLTVVGSAATPGRQKAIATAFTMLGQRFGPDFRARGLDLASQHNYAPLLDASGAAQLNVAGWFDGTYANAAFKRFNTLKPGSVRLLIGPWDHTQADISPYGVPGRTRFATIAALLAFADGRTAGRASLLDDAPIHYFTMGEQRWHATKSWPVQNRPTRLYLSDGGRLAAAPQPGEVPVRYLIDFTATTGGQTRYDTLLGHRLRTPYAKRAERDAQLVIHDGAPLAHDMEVTGHPIAHVRLATTATDGAVFAYLEDVWPDGRVTWVTDGQLRLLHRASATYPAATWAAGPPRSYRRADAKPMVPGEAEDIVFELLPTSYLFKAGHRIRLAIAGADKDHFARIPADPAEAPELTIARGGASWVELPVVTR